MFARLSSCRSIASAARTTPTCVQCRSASGRTQLDVIFKGLAVAPDRDIPTSMFKADAPEFTPEYYEQHHGHLHQPEYAPEQSWLHQFVNSKTCLECVADFNGTEFRTPLTKKDLKQQYKDQLATFESVTAPKLAEEGVSKYIIEKLQEVYHTRAFVGEWEIEAAINKFNFLGNEKTTYRVTDSGADMFPMWKSLMPVPFMNTSYIRNQYKGSEKTLGRHTETNEEAAMVNVRQLRGVIAFINAVQRGLTSVERAAVKAILVQDSTPIRLTDEEKADIDHKCEELRELVKTTPTAAEAGLEKLWALYKPGSHEKRYLRSQVATMLPKQGYLAVLDDTEHENALLEEGVHFFTKEALAAKRAGLVEQVRNWATSLVQNASPETKDFAQRFQNAQNELLSPEVQGDLEILELLRVSTMTDRQQDELLSIFRKADEGVDDSILMDVCNPHPVAQKLFGQRINLLMQERTEYTKNFHEGADSVWFREGNYEAGTEEVMQKEEFNAPPVCTTEFNTAMDQIFHMKLIRLAQDFYNIDFNTDLGISAFDRLIHAYDISPGEETLDRTHPSPPDQHCYEELPIIKFDGWEQCDEEQPADYSLAANVNLSEVESVMDENAKAIAAKDGQEFVPFRQLVAELSPESKHYLNHRLRQEIAFEVDAEKVELKKKLWSMVFNEHELQHIFEAKEAVIKESHH